MRNLKSCMQGRVNSDPSQHLWEEYGYQDDGSSPSCYKCKSSSRSYPSSQRISNRRRSSSVKDALEQLREDFRPLGFGAGLSKGMYLSPVFSVKLSFSSSPLDSHPGILMADLSRGQIPVHLKPATTLLGLIA